MKKLSGRCFTIIENDLKFWASPETHGNIGMFATFRIAEAFGGWDFVRHIFQAIEPLKFCFDRLLFD